MSGEDPFRYAPVSRRRFVQLSAATGASLTLPGNATASASSEKFTEEYEYVLNHTPADHAVQTLVLFSDQSGPAAMEALLDGGVHTTTEPEPAAYAQLTTLEAERVADLPMASEFQFSPGSNPFWRLGHYPLGIFPEPRRSVDFIGFEQLKDGLEELEHRCKSETYSQYENRIRVKNVGASPGHYNNLTDREDPKGMYVVELTNFDSATAFEDKEKVFFSCSLHGLEMAGRETGARVLENVARGSEPDVIEDEEKIEPYLNDVVVIIGFTNPDGWAARNPQYDSGWQVGGPGTGTPRAPAAPLYERGNAEVFDTNRQYPVVGYLRPSHNPANPGDNPSEQPDYINEKVPDAADLVEHFKGYDELNYGADLHGGPTFNNFVLGLISQDQFDTRELHEVYEMCLNIDEVLEQALEVWTTAGDLNKQLYTDDDGFTLDDVGNPTNFGFVPTEAFDYATIYDTIDYTVSGAFLDWMAHPEPIGLDLTTLDFEMSYNHMVGGNVYNPELFRMEVDGYRTAIRTITAFAVRNSDTPNTDPQFSAHTETGGEKVAYVTTGPVGSADDALRVSHEDLRFDVERVTTEEQSETFSGVIGPGTPNQRSRQEHTFTADDAGERVEATASWGANVQDNELYLLDPDGNRIASSTNFNALDGPENIEAAIEGGEEYTFVIETYANAAANYTIEASIQSVSYEETDGDDGETTSTNLTTATEEVDVGTGVTEVTYEVSGADLHSFGVEMHEHGLVADAELVNPDGEVVSEYEAVREGRIGGKCGTVPEFVVSEPDEGVWTFRLTNRLDQAKHGEVTFWTLSSPGPNPDPKEVFDYEQRDYTATPFRFFEDYAQFADDPTAIEPVTVQDIADPDVDALYEDGSRAYDHVVVIHDYGANGESQPGDGVLGYTASDHPAQGITTPGYTEKLDQFVDDGGNLVLTDAGLNLVPKLKNSLVDGSTLDDGAVQAADGYQVARFTDGKNLDHPLLTDARPIQNQLWKVQPLGYQAFSGAAGQAPMFAISEDALAKAGAGGVATVAGYNRQGVVAASVTDGEDSGRGVHLVGSLLPRATQTNVHAFGLLDYTVTFLGNLVLTSALGFEQVRDTGETTRHYGRGDSWDLGSVEPLAPPNDGGNGGGGSDTQLSASGTRTVERNVSLGGRATRVTVTLDTVTTDAGSVEVRDTFPPEWDFLGEFSDGEETSDGVVSFGNVTTANFDGAEFTYFIESPEDPAQTNQYQVGPGEVAVDTGDGEVTDEFAPAASIVAVGISP